MDTPQLQPQIYQKMLHYRTRLLAFGMQEAVFWKPSIYQQTWYFYKPATELTAFILNLTGHPDSVEIVYGYASTAFTRMAGDADALRQMGVSNQDINIRQQLFLRDGENTAFAEAQIFELYHRYLTTKKEELLQLAREMRKAFIAQISARLKPLGFRKKANTWTRPLEGEYSLKFNLQKSLYSDEYYHDIYIGKGEYGGCYYTRLSPAGSALVDWQLVPQPEMNAFWANTLLPLLTGFIQTPLSQLGKGPSLWAECTCDRKQCPHCWVAQNRWGQ